MNFCKTMEMQGKIDNHVDCMFAYALLDIIRHHQFNRLYSREFKEKKFSNTFRYVVDLFENNIHSTFYVSHSLAHVLINYAQNFVKEKNAEWMPYLKDKYIKFADFIDNFSTLNEAPGLWEDYIENFSINKIFSNEEIMLYTDILNNITSALSHRNKDRYRW